MAMALPYFKLIDGVNSYGNGVPRSCTMTGLGKTKERTYMNDFARLVSYARAASRPRTCNGQVTDATDTCNGRAP